VSFFWDSVQFQHIACTTSDTYRGHRNELNVPLHCKLCMSTPAGSLVMPWPWSLTLWPQKFVFILIPKCNADSLVKFSPVISKIIALTRPKSAFSSVLDSPWPWTLIFWSQFLMRSSLSRNAAVLKVWRKLELSNDYFFLIALIARLIILIAR